MNGESGFLAMLADVLEVPAIAPGDDYRTTHLWGSLTAFALKVTVSQRYGRDLTLGEICGFPNAGELMERVLS